MRTNKYNYLSGRVACDAREVGGHCACGGYHESNSGKNGRYVNGKRTMSYDFTAAVAQLKQLDTERDAQMIVLAETDNDDEFDKTSKRIDELHKEIMSLVVKYVQETHKVSPDEARAAMMLLDDYDREQEAVGDWICDERPAVNV